MSKPKTVPVPDPDGEDAVRERDFRSGVAGPNEPLSGSKRVKNRNHSRHNNGEG